MSDKTIHILAHGRVQGVCYRASTRDKGREFELKGTVKNLPNGSVEIHATGSEEVLENFVEWCRQGPPYANVTHLDVKGLEEVREFDGFTVLY